MNPAIDAELDEIAGHLNTQHARLVHAAAEVIADTNCWTMPGILTPEQFLCWRTGISRGTAERITAIARRVDELPACIEVFNRGEMSLDQLCAIVGKVPAWADTQIAELAPKLTVRQLHRLVSKYVFADIDEPDTNNDTDADLADVEGDVKGNDGDADLADEPLGPPIPENHRPPKDSPLIDVGGCRMWFDDNGRFHLHVDTDWVTGRTIEQAINEARDHLFGHGHTDVTWLDAMLEMAQRSMDGIDSPDRRNRWRLNLHLRTDGHCTDDCGHFLPDAIRRYLTCDGLLTPTFHANGIPISVGRSQRIVPDRTRRIVIMRDGGCHVPGCGATHHLEVHHIIHWDDNGPSDTWNLVTLCPHHHRMHHQGRLGISGNADVPDGVTYTDTDGRIIAASGITPKPPGGPPPPIAGHYRGPLGERLDMRWVAFHPPAHYSAKRREQWRNRTTVNP